MRTSLIENKNDIERLDLENVNQKLLRLNCINMETNIKNHNLLRIFEYFNTKRDN